MLALGSQITVSPSGKTSVGTPARQVGMVALRMPTARPPAVGPWGRMRPALHWLTSSSPARPFATDGVSNVSQNAAHAKPQPGFAIGPVGNPLSRVEIATAPPRPRAPPSDPDEAS